MTQSIIPQVKISVVLTLYNKENYIDRTLRSVLAQDFQFFEIVIVDDCSSDGSLDVVLGFTNEKIRIIRNSKNIGQAATINVGINASRGELIAFLDCDDLWLANYLSTVWSVYQSSDRKSLIYSNLLNYEPIFLEGRYIYPDILRNLSLASQSAISIPRVCLDYVGNFGPFFETDAEIRTKISKHFGVIKLKSPLVIAIKGPESMTANKGRVAEGREQLIEYYKNEIISINGLDNYFYHLFKLYESYHGAGLKTKAFGKVFTICRIGLKDNRYGLVCFYLLKYCDSLLLLLFRRILFVLKSFYRLIRRV